MVTIVIILLILGILNTKFIQLKKDGYIFLEDIYEPMSYVVYGVIGCVPFLNIVLLTVLLLTPLEVFITGMYENELIRPQNREERRGGQSKQQYERVNYKIKTKENKRN